MAPWRRSSHILQGYIPTVFAPPCCSSSALTCSNGVFGVEAGGTCCLTQFGTCDGVGYSDRTSAAGLTVDDCCNGRVIFLDIFRGFIGKAPCIIGDGERFGLVLLNTMGWNIARGTL